MSERPAQYTDIEGIMWPPAVTERSLKAIKEFETWDDDVWVATYPKSGVSISKAESTADKGTHWVSEICHLVNHNGDLEKVDRQQIQTPIEFQISPLIRSAEQTIPDFELAQKWTRPRVIVSHVPVEYLPRQVLEEGKGKVISVIRNPKDTAVSEFYFLKANKPGAPESFSQCLVENGTSEKAPYKTWFGHVLGYWAKRHHNQFLILKFEDMKRDTRGAIVQIADFMGRPLSDEVVDKIVDLVQVKSMTGRFYSAGEKNEGLVEKEMAGAPNLIRKGIVGDWKTHFTVAENEAYDALYRQKMAGSGLILQFE